MDRQIVDRSVKVLRPRVQWHAPVDVSMWNPGGKLLT